MLNVSSHRRPFNSILDTVCAFVALVGSTAVEGQPRVAASRELSAATLGEKAPPLVVTDASGQKRSISQLRGKKALLITFFPRCFTGNCATQLTSLRDSYLALQKAGVEVWGVSTDAAAGMRGQRAFAKHLKLPFPLIPDTQSRVSLAFGAVQTREQMAARMSAFIDKNGVVRWIDKQMDVRTHGADVLARLRTDTKVEAARSPSK